MSNSSINKTKLIEITLAHEFLRCTDALNSFTYLIATLPQNNNKRRRLNCYNEYVDFLSHLYEFYLYFIKSDMKFKQQGEYKDYPPFNGKKEHEIIDIIINEETQKLFRNRKNRILNGFKDNLGHRIDFYDCKIPKEFGEHFRFIRNRRNHADFKRASNEHDISLKSFFNQYHKFVLILYDECRWTSQVNENLYDWLAIDNFASEILK